MLNVNLGKAHRTLIALTFFGVLVGATGAGSEVSPVPSPTEPATLTPSPILGTVPDLIATAPDAPVADEADECSLKWLDYWECLIRNPHCPMAMPDC